MIRSATAEATEQRVLDELRVIVPESDTQVEIVPPETATPELEAPAVTVM